MINIGQTIAKERKKRGDTQEKLATFCHVSKASVSKWEKGQTYPDITLLPKLAAYFNITVDELLNAKVQQSKEDIQHIYHQFAQRFADEPFQTVYQDVIEWVSLYANDPQVLLQSSVLLLNHVTQQQEANEVLSNCLQRLERIPQLTDELWMIEQATALAATIHLMRNEPDEVLSKLAYKLKPSLAQEFTLTAAYLAKGEIEQANEVIQVTSYQHVLQLVGFVPMHLQAAANDPWKIDQIEQRALAVISAYALDRIHPNTTLNAYYAFVLHFCQTEQYERAQHYLIHYMQVVREHLFPVTLKGDAYFDQMDDWLQTLDLGTVALRSDKMIKQSIIESLHHPFIKAFETTDWFQEHYQALVKELSQ